jgi:hypothetical protein
MTSHETGNPVFEENQSKHTQSSGLNVARCVYRTHKMLDLYTNQIYQPLFDEQLHPVLINLVNTNTTTPAFYPPHVDQKRITSLNFYIEPGGDNVTTSFYKEEGNFDLLGSSKNYDEVTVDYSLPMNDKAWYLLDVNRYHSVENILTNRFIFCLSFADLTVEQFKIKYKKYFV